MADDLGTVLASAREDVSILKKLGNGAQAEYIENLLDRVKESAEDYLAWLSEDEAYLKSGLSRRTLRRRFRELLDSGLARYGAHGAREYRSCAVPPRPDAALAKAAGFAGQEMKRAS